MCKDKIFLIKMEFLDIVKDEWLKNPFVFFFILFCIRGVYFPLVLQKNALFFKCREHMVS